MEPRRALLQIYRAALAAVDGRRAVANALAAEPPPAGLRAVAVGKAADAMLAGALDAWGDALQAGLLITKAGHVDPGCYRQRPVQVLESAHPLPDRRSLAAGQALLEFLAAAPADAGLLFLISGGASSLVEVLPRDWALDDLQALNRHLLAAGADIHAINRLRRACSRIKGGRLAAHLAGREARVLLISDVEGDDPAVIGSGLLAQGRDSPLVVDELPAPLRHLPLAEPPPSGEAFRRVSLRIVARNADALAAAAARAGELGYPVHRHDRFLRGEAAVAGAGLAAELLEGPAGVHLWGGEPTVTLPEQPGQGGRMQQLALAAALRLQDRAGVYLLAAGTDGSDGPGEDAGALVDAATIERCRDGGVDPRASLARADAGSALAAAGDLIQTGPTGSNVMDLVIGLKAV